MDVGKSFEIDALLFDYQWTTAHLRKDTADVFADDAKEETINNRIKTYHDKTEPLVGFYQAAGKYNEIDGVGTIEEVRDRIAKLMQRF